MSPQQVYICNAHVHTHTHTQAHMWLYVGEPKPHIIQEWALKLTAFAKFSNKGDFVFFFLFSSKT